jgi:putative flippase GtrA
MLRALLVRLLHSAGAGGVATLVDLGSLTAMVSLFGLSPRVANVPSLLLGSLVMFFGLKRFAFRGRGGGGVRREVALFTVVQLVGVALSAILFDALVLHSPLAQRWYVGARLVASSVVWLGFSFPAWHWVFRARQENDAPRSLSGP